MKFQRFFIALAIAALTPIPVMSQPQRADWRYWESFNGKHGRVDKYIDILSVRQAGDVWEFWQMDKSADGRDSYMRIRVNCKQGYLDHVQSRIVSGGRTIDNSRDMDILDGVQPYMTQSYCQMFGRGNLAAMPRQWQPGRTIGGTSSDGRCNSPDDLDSRGRRCGGRASGNRSGGR